MAFISSKFILVAILAFVFASIGCITQEEQTESNNWPRVDSSTLGFPVLYLTENGIGIDGNKEDWPRVIPAIIDSDCQVVKGTRGKMGWFGGIIECCFDPSNLYIYAELEDTTPFKNENSGFYIWEGDSLELYLGFHEEKHSFMDKNDFQVGISIVRENPVFWNWSTKSLLEGVEFKMLIKGSKAMLEMRIPVSNFGQDTVSNETPLWLDFGLNNSLLGKKREGQMIWYGDDRDYQKPDLWKKAVITSDAEKLNAPFLFAPGKLRRMIQYRVYVYSGLKPWQGTVYAGEEKRYTDHNGRLDIFHDSDEALDIRVPVGGNLLYKTIRPAGGRMIANNLKPYRGAELRTKESFLYGRFVVSMKPAASSGIVSSFFTYHDPKDFSIDKWNEIDIEFLGKNDSIVQFNTITPYQRDHAQEHELPYPSVSGFHTCGFEWTPDYVSFSLDCEEVYRQEQAHIEELVHPQKIMMNIWQPNYPAWVGTFEAKDLPLYAYYDWVEYYEYTPGKKETFKLAWRDDFNAYDESRWTAGTHTWDGNNSIFTADNAVFADGKLVLCLTLPEKTGYGK